MIEPERGMILPLVALMLSVLIGVSALIVDLGSARRSQQELITAADAAALAGAYDAATGVASACTTADSYLASNAPLSSITSCTTTGTSSGRLSLAATIQSDAWFAPALGLGNQITVNTASVAAWGPPSGVSELIPLAFCRDATELAALLSSPPTSPTAFRVDFAEPVVKDCGNTGAGAFGEIHFDDVQSHPSHSRFEDWIEDGYEDVITLNAPGATSCPTAASCLYGSTNNGTHWPNHASELNDHITSGELLYVPIYDYAVGIGSTQYSLVGVIQARLTNYNVWGDPTTWFFEMTAEPGLIPGRCCGESSTTGGTVALALCAVDPTDLGACP